MTVDRETDIVATPAGQVRGLKLNKVQVFRGIPYAAPPVGPLRFRPPVPHDAWDGVRETTDFGAVAWQQITPLEQLHGTHLYEQSEDCLTLNVWTPAADDGNRPVLVWIHGGAYVNGNGACPDYDGTAFAQRHGVVVVTINYRINVFGYLHLAELSPDEVGSGNCGLLDQVAALQWVHDSIGAFGGDPGNVTVAGESAGAMSVGALLAVPAAQGLFQRAVLQSGAPNARTSAGATAVTRRLLDYLGIPADADAGAALRSIPAEELEAAYVVVSTQLMLEVTADSGFTFAPVVDGHVLPQDPIDAIRAGSVRDVPLLIGTDLDEMQVMQIVAPEQYGCDEASLRQRFAAVFGEQAERAASLYADQVKGTDWNPWWQVEGDRLFLLPATALAEAQRAAGGGAWMYLFAWRSPAEQGRLGAMHTMEIPFVFHTLDRGSGPFITGGPSVETSALSDIMNDAWAAFARDGSCSWPGYETSRRATMVFDAQSELVDDPQRERRLLWEAILPR